jgi:hypothetical protein
VLVQPFSFSYWAEQICFGANLFRQTRRRDRVPSSLSKQKFDSFRTYFGTFPLICSVLWAKVDPLNTISLRARPIHLLWALLFMKQYSTENFHGDIVGCDQKTFRNWAWLFVDAIESLRYQVIKWENRFIDGIGEERLAMVDGTDSKIRRASPYSKKCWRYKFKCAGLRYEIAISIRTGYIAWINRPFLPGDTNVISMFQHRLMFMLADSERIGGDKGYRGESRHVYVHDGENNAEDALREGRHEKGNARFKQWECLRQEWRHSPLKQHAKAFRAIAVIEQLEIENGEPIWN